MEKQIISLIILEWPCQILSLIILSEFTPYLEMSEEWGAQNILAVYKERCKSKFDIRVNTLK